MVAVGGLIVSQIITQPGIQFLTAVVYGVLCDENSCNDANHD